MTGNELSSRIETLEVRFLDQEAALDELTRTLLNQERLLKDQAETIKRLELQLLALSSSNVAMPEEDTPPPHY
jgi:SlyX protein